MSQGVTGCHRVSQGVTGCHRVCAVCPQVREHLEDLLVSAGDVIALQHDAGPGRLLHCPASPLSPWRQPVLAFNLSEWFWARRAADRDPGDSDPGDSDPRDSDPRDSDPRDSDPGDSDPGDSDPRDPYPGDRDPGDSDPGDSDPGDSDPRDSDPGHRDPGDRDGLVLDVEALVQDGEGAWLGEVVCPVRVLYVGQAETPLQGGQLSAGLETGIYTLQVSHTTIP